MHRRDYPIWWLFCSLFHHYFACDVHVCVVLQSVQYKDSPGPVMYFFVEYDNITSVKHAIDKMEGTYFGTYKIKVDVFALCVDGGLFIVLYMWYV